MTQKTAKQFSPELRERAVRMVQDREREGGTQWEFIGSGDFAARSAEIAAKFGCSRETFRLWVRQGERDVAGTPSVCGWGRDPAWLLGSASASGRWSVECAGCGRPMGCCARRRRVLPKVSSAAL